MGLARRYSTGTMGMKVEVPSEPGTASAGAKAAQGLGSILSRTSASHRAVMPVSVLPGKNFGQFLDFGYLATSILVYSSETLQRPCGFRHYSYRDHMCKMQ